MSSPSNAVNSGAANAGAVDASQPVAQPSNRPHHRQIGPYRIEAEVSRSRVQIVYRAHDTLYDRPILLKILADELAKQPALVRRFISLGRDAARLHHPHLVEIYEAGHADGVNYIAQEFLGGGSLATRLQNRHHPYLIYDAVAMIEPLAAALDYAHQQGYIHGALTADSILFTADNQPKIENMGLLPLATLGAQSSYAANVSPYMAPEQARGEGAIARAADIYTLGIITFVLLTGQPPFVADNPLALLRKIIDDAPPVDELLGGAIPAHVSKTLARVLAKQAEARHANATAFATALVHGEPRPARATATTAAADPTPDETPDNTIDGTIDGATDDDAVMGDWEEIVIDVEPAQASWQVTTGASEQPFVPLEERAAAAAYASSLDEPVARHKSRRSLLTLSMLGTAALLLTVVTVGRLVWTTFGAQMVDAALTPYAAAQAGRLTPPQPPTMLTVADTPFFAGALVRTTDLLRTEQFADSDQPQVQTMSSVLNSNGGGTDAGDSVAQLTGSPAMVVVAPSSTPTDAPTDTPFPTDTPVPTATTPPTDTPTELPTDTPLPTATPLPTDTPSPTPLPSDTPTTAPTPSPTLSPTASATGTPTATATETGTPTVTPTATVDPARITGRIAYTRWDPRVDRYDLIFYSIPKNESWPIVPNRRQPDFGPNGQLIASGDGGFIDNLVLMGTNGENPVPVSAHPEDAHPHWSPSGKQVVFDSTLVGDGRHRLYLHTNETFGQPLTPMMFEAWELFGRYPVFLSNGEIAYNGCDVWENASTCGIFRVDTQGSRPENVTTYPGDIPTDNWGNQILAMSNRNGSWDIYRVDPLSGAAQQLTDNPGRDGLATASPNGEHIAFVSDRGGTWAVYTMRADGSEERKLFELGGGFGSGDRDWLQERISWGQ